MSFTNKMSCIPLHITALSQTPASLSSLQICGVIFVTMAAFAKMALAKVLILIPGYFVWLHEWNQQLSY
jgi:hypothetical protein